MTRFTRHDSSHPHYSLFWCLKCHIFSPPRISHCSWFCLGRLPVARTIRGTPFATRAGTRQDTRPTVVGSNLKKALDLWTSLPANKIKATPVGDSKPDVAVFDLQVAADAPVGLFGLRVATADGLSNVHLCLIDDLPIRAAPDSVKDPAKVEITLRFGDDSARAW